ncbi:UbiA prenyltransferase family [Vararia minispora EC-137]|uniref:UbiA prenyltransferase family n=1 Tax=Vararia minispora EC-137 TaxID=1314806 RepID=A0ACB8QSD3_9AGAM|nr:UbiA prenyltransferase family [Vararia minispora EC-137]
MPKSPELTRPSPQPTASALRPKLVYYFQLTRLHKFPLGNILVIWPCLWSLAMVAYKQDLDVQNFSVLAGAFILGGTLVHSAACVINDICDIDFDRQVERCKDRPLPSGLISLHEAWLLLAILTCACLALLSFAANTTAILVGLFGIFPLHGLYPLMKRWTYWPQAWLGFAMNWGFPVAWLTVAPDYDKSELILFATSILGCVCWTIVYDTEYACQDRKDDAKAGVKSTALLFGDHVRSVLAVFAILFLASLVLIGVLNGQTAVYFVVSCGGAAAHLAWQLRFWDVDDPADCGAKFKANGDLGYFVSAGLLLDYAVAKVY